MLYRTWLVAQPPTPSQEGVLFAQLVIVGGVGYVTTN